MTAEDQIGAVILPEYQAAQIASGNVTASNEVFVDQVLYLDPIAGALSGIIQTVLPLLDNAFKTLLSS